MDKQKIGLWKYSYFLMPLCSYKIEEFWKKISALSQDNSDLKISTTKAYTSLYTYNIWRCKEEDGGIWRLGKEPYYLKLECIEIIVIWHDQAGLI